jgi:hypothetical protein
MALARQSRPDQGVTKDMTKINGVAEVIVADRRGQSPRYVDSAIQKLA